MKPKVVNNAVQAKRKATIGDAAYSAERGVLEVVLELSSGELLTAKLRREDSVTRRLELGTADRNRRMESFAELIRNARGKTVLVSESGRQGQVAQQKGMKTML
jgi:hypothetical protein